MAADDTQFLIETLKAATPWHVFVHMGLTNGLLVAVSLTCAVAAVVIALQKPVAADRRYSNVKRLRLICLVAPLLGAIYVGIDAWVFYGFSQTYARPLESDPMHLLLPRAVDIGYTLLVSVIAWLVTDWAVRRIKGRNERVRPFVF